MNSTLRVALLGNRKADLHAAVDAPPDALAEYDAQETFEAITQALSSRGHEVFFLPADASLVDTLRHTYPDICFNIAEGLRGDAREAQVPALLELLEIPYTGSKVLANAISLDKGFCKRVWRDAGLPTAPFQVFTHWETPLDARLTYPLFVKPVREGTGMGINADSIIHDEAALRRQLHWVITTYHEPALVETYLPGREFTVGILGNRYTDKHPTRSSFYDTEGFHVIPVMEIDAWADFQGVFNAKAKSFMPGETGAPDYLCPADIPIALNHQLRQLTVAAFETIGALDVSRVDFRLGADNKPYLVEINTLPGLRPILSDICIAADAEQLPYEMLVNEILDLARERYGLL